MKRFAFFPGCLIPARHPAMEFAIRETMPRLDIELVDLEGASCCPDPIYFKSKDKLSWLAVAARNLTLAEDMGLDIFTNCSGCTATLSETRHLLEDEEDVRAYLQLPDEVFSYEYSVERLQAAEQAVGGIKAAVEWVNSSYGGVSVGGALLFLCILFDGRRDHE